MWGRKAPGSDVEAVLVFVYYMQHVMALSKIGPAHVMTAFKEVGKPTPVDLKHSERQEVKDVVEFH